jgi:hypothetical protein
LESTGHETEVDAPQPEAEPGAPESVADAGTRITHARTEEECELCNGTWGPRGIIGAVGCVCPTLDGGKPCRSPRDCEHRCELPWEEAVAAGGQIDCALDGDCGGGLRIPEGTCSHDYDIFGCRAWMVEVETDRGPRLQVRAICVD